MSDLFREGEGLTENEEESLAAFIGDAVAVRGLFLLVAERAVSKSKQRTLASKGVVRDRTSRMFQPIPITRPDGRKQSLGLRDTTTLVRIEGMGATTTLWSGGYDLTERVGRRTIEAANVTLPTLMRVQYDDGNQGGWHFAEFGGVAEQMEGMSSELYELAIYRLGAALSSLGGAEPSA